MLISASAVPRSVAAQERWMWAIQSAIDCSSGSELHSLEVCVLPLDPPDEEQHGTTPGGRPDGTKSLLFCQRAHKSG
jgi:hypothetical protein